MDSGVKAFWRGESALAAELRLMALPRERRKRALGQIGREVKKQARKNVKNQVTTSGKAFKQRVRKRTREGEMLSGFVKGSNIRQRSREMSVTVDFKNDVMGRMATEHQKGKKQTMRARPMSAQQVEEWKNEEASMEQASAIMRFGYRWNERGADGKRKARLSRRWIVENLTKWQALGLLFKLKNRQQGKKTWQADLPAREFFPNDAQWVKRMAFDVITKELNRGK